MSVFDQPAMVRTYDDPSLWNRLLPLVRQELAEREQNMLQGRWDTMEQAREQIGVMRGLHWVLNTARELTQVENHQDG